MIFLWSDAQQFEEEDEEEGGNLNDALLDELVGDLEDEDILDGEVPPPVEVVPPEALDEEETEDATALAFLAGEDEEEEDADMDYDSFDDKDDL
jgi:hypothetical protein